jgi:hypothetical protein
MASPQKERVQSAIELLDTVAAFVLASEEGGSGSDPTSPEELLRAVEQLAAVRTKGFEPKKSSPGAFFNAWMGRLTRPHPPQKLLVELGSLISKVAFQLLPPALSIPVPLDKLVDATFAIKGIEDKALRGRLWKELDHGIARRESLLKLPGKGVRAYCAAAQESRMSVDPPVSSLMAAAVDAYARARLLENTAPERAGALLYPLILDLDADLDRSTNLRKDWRPPHPTTGYIWLDCSIEDLDQLYIDADENTGSDPRVLVAMHARGLGVTGNFDFVLDAPKRLGVLKGVKLFLGANAYSGEFDHEARELLEVLEQRDQPSTAREREELQEAIGDLREMFENQG